MYCAIRVVRLQFEQDLHSSVHWTFKLFKVRMRAREFFKDLCIKVKEVWDKEGNSGPLAVAGRRQRGASSLCSNSSEVFVSSGSPVDNNNMAPPELVLDTIPTQGKHDNSGSTSSTSGYSSGGTDSCEQLSPLEPSHSPGANIPQSYEGGLFQNVHTASLHMSIPPTHGDGSTKSALQVPMGCPNVSLSPIAEDHLMRIPSISSGRGSFDDTDSMLSASYNPDVLLVSHGGLLKEDQCLPTARDQRPKQVHFPLTLHCKCSQTERTHIASSKPQPGVRKAIAHCATAFSTDTLYYPEKSLRQADKITVFPPGTLPLHTDSVQPSAPAFSKRRQIFGQYFGDILRGRQRLFYMEWWHFCWTFIELILNLFCMNFNELFMNFWNVLYWFYVLIITMYCIDFCYEFWLI